MPSSEKRVAANRVNAAKSTGPRTPGGKEKSCLNAVKHGLTAQTSVLPGENPDQLEALSNSLMKQLKPRGVVQRIIAERIVSITWKLRRVARAEEAVAREMEHTRQEDWKEERKLAAENPVFEQFVEPRPKPRDAGMLLAEAMWIREERGLGVRRDLRLPRLTEYELKLDAALRAGMRELLRLQKDAAAFEEVGEEIEPVPEVAEATPGKTVEPPPEQNEPNVAPETEDESDQGHGTDDPGLRSVDKLGAGCAAPAACGGTVGATEAPVEKTNPSTGAETPAPDGAQVEEAPGVTPGLPTGSSAPAPGTSSSPPPGPRR